MKAMASKAPGASSQEGDSLRAVLEMLEEGGVVRVLRTARKDLDAEL